MTDFIAALARKWCRGKHVQRHSTASCICHVLKPTIREALEEAEKIIRGHATRIAEADKGKKWPTKETARDIGLLIALAGEVAALRGKG